MALSDNAKALQNTLLEAFGETSSDLYEDGKLVTMIRPLAPSTKDKASYELMPLDFYDRSTDINDGARFMNALVAMLVNCEETPAARIVVRRDDQKPLEGKNVVDALKNYASFFDAISVLVGKIDKELGQLLDSVYHNDSFQALEATWRGIDELASGVESPDVIIDFLDASKEELRNDLCDHETDIFGGELFKKVYIEEYDRYGGKPFASMIGLYEFDSTDQDIDWLRAMGKVANASHCPFVSSIAPDFIQPCKDMQEVANIADLDALLSHPRMAKWQELRDTDYAAYIGLCLPRYLMRAPFGHGLKLEPGNEVGYKETVIPGRTDDAGNFLWGNAAVLFAKNMVRSYESSGWAQHIRGPKGGGICSGLTVYTYEKNGYEEIQPPVEIAIPDFRERQFSDNGLISLVHKKNEAVATFFSAQSIKMPRTFVEDINTKNAFLVTNLAYTFSITRIAHFVKRMMREYIGSTADGPYIQQVLANWLGGYVTTIMNPDDLTLRYYPFKAVNVAVEDKPGPFGWYKAVISVLPHAQFEGMDVELRLEAALGGP